MSVILDILPKRETHLCYPFFSAHSCRLEKGILGSSPDQCCGSCYLHHIWQWECSTMGSNGGEERRGWGKWDHAYSYIKYNASQCAKVTKLWYNFKIFFFKFWVQHITSVFDLEILWGVITPGWHFRNIWIIGPFNSISTLLVLDFIICCTFQHLRFKKRAFSDFYF